MPDFLNGGKVYSAHWRVDGPAFQSVEDTSYGPGRLGVDYTVNVDTRFGGACLGPLRNDVDCGAAGGTAANANGIAFTNTMHATKFLIVPRGTKYAKIQASNMTLISDGTQAAQGERVTGVIYTKNAAGTEEVSLLMAGTAYDVITAAGAGATDTVSVNDENITNRVANYGYPSNTILAAGGQIIRHNTLTGSVGMDACAWQTRATLTGEASTFTSIALDGDKIYAGTNNGPYYFDNEFQEWRELIPEIATDPDNVNARAMTTWYSVGVLVPLKKALYRTRAGSGGSVGPEVFPFNESPVQGYFTALWGSERWLYGALYNPTTDQTYILAGRPPTEGDPWQDKYLVWFPIMALGSGIECEFLRDIETYGGRTNPTLVGGYDDDVFYVTMGRLTRETDDTNYRYAASGNLYLTTLLRDPHIDKYPVGFEFETEGCDSGKTVTLYVNPDGAGWEQVGSPVGTNGKHRVFVPAGDGLFGASIKLRFDYATDSSSSTPRLKRTGVDMFYRVAERVTDGFAPGWV